jgi:hypothetical protein
MKQAYKLIIAVGILVLLVILNIFFLRLTKSIFEHTKNKIEIQRNKITVLTQINSNSYSNLTLNSSLLGESNLTIIGQPIEAVNEINSKENVFNEKKFESNTTLRKEEFMDDPEFRSDVEAMNKIYKVENASLNHIAEEEENEILKYGEQKIITNTTNNFNVIQKENADAMSNQLNNIDETIVSDGKTKNNKSSGGSKILMFFVCDLILVALGLFIYQLYKNYKKYDFLNHNLNEYKLMNEHNKNI